MFSNPLLGATATTTTVIPPPVVTTYTFPSTVTTIEYVGEPTATTSLIAPPPPPPPLVAMLPSPTLASPFVPSPTFVEAVDARDIVLETDSRGPSPTGPSPVFGGLRSETPIPPPPPEPTPVAPPRASLTWTPLDKKRIPTILAILGSQFCIKVMAAFDHKGIPHRVVLINPADTKKVLPPPYTVPVLRWADVDTPDSTAILHLMDKFVSGQKFFPSQRVVDLDRYLGDVFNLFVLYFNWIDPQGFKHSTQARFEKPLPSIMRWAIPTSLLTQSYRVKVTEQIQNSPFANAFVTSVSASQELHNHLRYLEGHFATPRQAYLCATQEPTAADFALYGMMHHLIGWSGDANLPPCQPNCLHEAQTPLLFAWFQRMSQAYPVQFRGRA